IHAGNLRRTSLPWSYVFGSASRGLQGGLCDSTTHRCFVRPLVFNLLSRLCADFLSRERSPPKRTDLVLAQDLLDHLGHGHVLKDPAVPIQGQQPQLGADGHAVVRVPIWALQTTGSGDNPAEIASLVVCQGQADRQRLAQQGLWLEDSLWVEALPNRLGFAQVRQFNLILVEAAQGLVALHLVHGQHVVLQAGNHHRHCRRRGVERRVHDRRSRWKPMLLGQIAWGARRLRRRRTIAGGLARPSEASGGEAAGGGAEGRSEPSQGSHPNIRTPARRRPTTRPLPPKSASGSMKASQTRSAVHSGRWCAAARAASFRAWDPPGTRAAGWAPGRARPATGHSLASTGTTA